MSDGLGLVNVFEDARGVRADGGWLRRIRELDIMPDGYGVAWLEWHQRTAICAPVPFNRLLGWVHRYYSNWRAYRTPSLLDAAFTAGLAAGREACDVRIAHETARCKRVTASEYARGVSDVKRALADDIMREFRAGRMH